MDRFGFESRSSAFPGERLGLLLVGPQLNLAGAPLLFSPPAEVELGEDGKPLTAEQIQQKRQEEAQARQIRQQEMQEQQEQFKGTVQSVSNQIRLDPDPKKSFDSLMGELTKRKKYAWLAQYRKKGDGEGGTKGFQGELKLPVLQAKNGTGLRIVREVAGLHPSNGNAYRGQTPPPPLAQDVEEAITVARDHCDQNGTITEKAWGLMTARERQLVRNLYVLVSAIQQHVNLTTAEAPEEDDTPEKDKPKEEKKSLKEKLQGASEWMGIILTPLFLIQIIHSFTKGRKEKKIRAAEAKAQAAREAEMNERMAQLDERARAAGEKAQAVEGEMGARIEEIVRRALEEGGRHQVTEVGTTAADAAVGGVEVASEPAAPAPEAPILLTQVRTPGTPPPAIEFDFELRLPGEQAARNFCSAVRRASGAVADGARTPVGDVRGSTTGLSFTQAAEGFILLGALMAVMEFVVRRGYIDGRYTKDDPRNQEWKDRSRWVEGVGALGYVAYSLRALGWVAGALNLGLIIVAGAGVGVAVDHAYTLAGVEYDDDGLAYRAFTTFGVVGALLLVLGVQLTAAVAAPLGAGILAGRQLDKEYDVSGYWEQTTRNGFGTPRLAARQAIYTGPNHAIASADYQTNDEGRVQFVDSDGSWSILNWFTPEQSYGEYQVGFSGKDQARKDDLPKVRHWNDKKGHFRTEQERILEVYKYNEEKIADWKELGVELGLKVDVSKLALTPDQQKRLTELKIEEMPKSVAYLYKMVSYEQRVKREWHRLKAAKLPYKELMEYHTQLVSTVKGLQAEGRIKAFEDEGAPKVEEGTPSRRSGSVRRGDWMLPE